MKWIQNSILTKNICSVKIKIKIFDIYMIGWIYILRCCLCRNSSLMYCWFASLASAHENDNPSSFSFTNQSITEYNGLFKYKYNLFTFLIFFHHEMHIYQTDIVRCILEYIFLTSFLLVQHVTVKIHIFDVLIENIIP